MRVRASSCEFVRVRASGGSSTGIYWPGNWVSPLPTRAEERKKSAKGLTREEETSMDYPYLNHSGFDPMGGGGGGGGGGQPPHPNHPPPPPPHHHHHNSFYSDLAASVVCSGQGMGGSSGGVITSTGSGTSAGQYSPRYMPSAAAAAAAMRSYGAAPCATGNGAAGVITGGLRSEQDSHRAAMFTSAMNLNRKRPHCTCSKSLCTAIWSF